MKRIHLSLDLANEVQADGLKGTLDDQMRRNQVLLGRLPSNMLTGLNVPDLELVTSVATVEKMIFDHGLTPAIIASLHGHICAASAVYKSATHGDTIVVLTMQIARGHPVIAAIRLNKPDSFMKPNIHWLASAYPKDHHDMIIQWGRQGLLLWKP